MWPFNKKKESAPKPAPSNVSKPKAVQNIAKPRPVWRKPNGVIDCPGDACPQKCDDSCPIWCNTMLLNFARIGELDLAIEYGKKAVALAPDAADFMNNLATMYGLSNRHQEAYDCFKKALELRPFYPEVLNGLKVAKSHLPGKQ